MMDVMVFDAGRRGSLISQAELSEYTRKLAMAVTEAIYYFIGHADPSPRHAARYLAVSAAHIVHMLRDALEDVDAGYFNIPRELLALRGMSPREAELALSLGGICVHRALRVDAGYYRKG